MLSESSEERACISILPFSCLFLRQRKCAAVKYRVEIEVDRGHYRQWQEDGEETAGKGTEEHRGNSSIWGSGNRSLLLTYATVSMFEE